MNLLPCPKCGKQPGHPHVVEENLYEDVRIEVKGMWCCCGFLANSELKWNEYAVAMELALAYLWEKQESKAGRTYMTRHKGVLKKLYEVFGGTYGVCKQEG